jgi:hypothetical protein
MSKIILRGNQEAAILWALDIAVNSFYTGDAEQDAEFKESRQELERLQASIEKQLGVNAGEPIPAKKSKVVGCLNCGHRTTDSQEIAEWTGCPNCSKN